MTTSRSIASPSNPLARALLALLAAACALLIGARAAEAGRKRVVILEFTGPKADDFRDDVEKLVKKAHSVVPLARWRSTADDLNATKVNEKDVKKVARKLSIDGVISGKVEKRGSRYLVHLQLREGATGKTVAAPDLVERAAKIGPDGRDTIKQELLPAIADLESSGDDDEDVAEADEDEDDRPSMGKRGKAKAKAKAREEDEADDAEAEEDEEEAPRTAKGKGKAKEKPRAKEKPKARPPEDEDDADDEPADDGETRFGKGRDRDDEDDRGDDDRVAARDDDRGGGDDDDAQVEDEVDTRGPRDPRRRPIDVAVGLSFTGRRLTFASNLTMNKPQGYKGNPVPGIYIAVDAFPLGLDRRKRGLASRIGVQLLFDRVISINSQLEKMNMVYDLPTTEQHLAGGLVYRHLLGAKLELDASVRFNKRTFKIDKTADGLVAGDVDVPNTSYAYVDPGVALGYVLNPRMMVGGGARFLVVLSTGQMQQTDQYGAASILGLDLEAGLDYRLTSKILVRAGARLTTLGFTFKGDGALTTMRDGDPDQDVSGARDTYFGGFATGVYLF